MSARFSVTTYWCSTAPAGSSIAGEPADVARPDAGGVDDDLALDVALVRADRALTRRSSTSIAVTRTRSTMRTPPARAPLA